MTKVMKLELEFALVKNSGTYYYVYYWKNVSPIYVEQRKRDPSKNLKIQ